MGLLELGLKYGTDKASVHGYLPIYDELLSKTRVQNLLEIGVAKGASLRMWREYFIDAMIWGIDVKKINLNDSRIQIIAGNVTDIKISKMLVNEIFDVIIDDGSHIISDQILTLCYMWAKLRRGGFYFIEDIGGWHGKSINTDEVLNYFEIFGPKIYRIHKNGRRDDVLLLLRKP